MTRLLRHVLFALLLLFSQQAAQLHALGHALAPAGNALALGAAFGSGAGAAQEDGAPATGHPAEHCLAFHAIDSVLAGMAPSASVACVGITPVALFPLPLPLALRVAFDSRAPPLIS